MNRESNPANRSATGTRVNRAFLLRVSFIAGLGGILYGFDMGVIAGVMVFVQESFPLSTRMEEIVVSVVLVGAMLGATAGGSIADRIGRRATLLWGGAIFLAGSLLAFWSPNVTTLIAARGLLGIAIGFTSVTAPVYISELAPPQSRGLLIGLYQFALTIGIVLADLAGYWLAAQHAWRLMFGLGVVPAALLLVLVVTLPESPRWLYAQNRMAEVMRVLSSYTDEAGAQSLIEEIRAALAIPVKQRWRELWSPAVRTSLLIAVGFTVLQQVTGINTIIYYGPRIFALAGITSNRNAIFATLLVAVTNMLATVIALDAGGSGGTQAAAVCGPGRNDDMPGSAGVFLSLSGRIRSGARGGGDDLPDGLHHLFRVQYGAHRVDPGVGGFSPARARARRGCSIARLRRGEFSGLNDFSFVDQSRRLCNDVPDLCGFLRGHRVVCALHRPGDPGT